MRIVPIAEQVAAATPATRNRYVDLLRALSITVVVLGHWLMAVIGWEDGEIVGGHLLALAPGLRLLTWVLQVMPVFFIVGGFANAASWESARDRGLPYPDWLRTRFTRLLRPTAVFVAVWTVLAVLLRAAGVEPELLEVGARLVAVPLWFLAVYALVIPAAPAMLALHRRRPLLTVGALVAGAALVDLAGWGYRVPVVGWLNFPLVWLAVHQLGFFWRDGTLTARRGLPWLLAVGGLGTLWALVALGPYPVSMVGIDEAGRTNNTPPSIVLVALGTWQLGLALTLERVVNRRLERPAAWLAVVTANRMIMTVYLWHLTAMALVTLALYPTGLWPRVDPLGPAWWALRPVWLAVLATALVPLVLVFWRFERTVPDPAPVGPGPGRAAAAVAGAAAVCAGLALLALFGFFTPGLPGGLPLGALVPFLLGLALLRLWGPTSRTAA